MERLSSLIADRSWSSILSDPKILGTAAAIIMAYYYMKEKREFDAIRSSFDSQSVELPVCYFLKFLSHIFESFLYSKIMHIRACSYVMR